MKVLKGTDLVKFASAPVLKAAVFSRSKYKSGILGVKTRLLLLGVEGWHKNGE